MTPSSLMGAFYPNRTKIDTCAAPPPVAGGGAQRAPTGWTGRSARLPGLGLRARVELDLLLRARHALLELPRALDLRVELDAEEQRHVDQPEPDQEDDDAGQRAVGLVVAAEVAHVEREQR